MRQALDIADKKLAVDAMGGDLGPSEIIAGISLALKETADLPEMLLVGNEEVLHSLLKEAGLDGNKKVTVVHASEVIEMDDKPIQSLKAKRDSSMVKAIELVKEGQAHAVLSCGNTGSLMAGGTLKLRPINGFERPALAGLIPDSVNHMVLILDVGANPTPTPDQMVHNAILGYNYYQSRFGIERPTVGLLTIGTEEGKGNVLANESHQLLKKMGGIINYVGLIEGFQIFKNSVDVVVCDGFVGNILLKSSESLMRAILGILKTEVQTSFIRKIGGFLARGAFQAVKKHYNPDQYGAVPLLGLNGLMFKAHGSSNRIAIKNAIIGAGVLFQHDMTEKLERDVAEANAILKS